MIIINMNIAKTVDIISHFQFANLRYHHQQKGITGNIKRYSQKNIGTSLVQLKRKFSLGNIKLEHRMTGRQSHVWNFGDIPCGNDQSAGIRIFFRSEERRVGKECSTTRLRDDAKLRKR